jgi:hypothetical protein
METMNGEKGFLWREEWGVEILVWVSGGRDGVQEESMWADAFKFVRVTESSH